MSRNIWWAAFLASGALLVTVSAATAASAGRPTYACFAAANAAAIGRLGADDRSVRYGFETGACLALPAGAPIADVQRVGNQWRFRAYGAKPYLYAADWAAGFQPTNEAIPPGFERYLQVTANLLTSGRTYAQCYDEGERLSQRIADHDRRVRRYVTRGRSPGEGQSSPKVIIYVGDEGPRLAAEDAELRREANAYDRRCGRLADMEADQDFVGFVRTIQA